MVSSLRPILMDSQLIRKPFKDKNVLNVHSSKFPQTQKPIFYLSNMQTQYSADDIAAASSLQISSYIFTSMATFWTYDYVCSLGDEWTFLYRSRWTKVKVLYILTRFVPFFLLIGHLYLNFSSDEEHNNCQMLNYICVCFAVISAVCSESIFVLRTYALWNNNKIVLAAMLSTFLVLAVGIVSVCFAANATSPAKVSAIPGITGCYQTSGSVELYVPFLLLFVLELGLLSLTLVRAVQSWRTANGPLYTILVKHNIFYYACGLFFSAVNVFTSLLLPYAYNHAFQDFQLIILAILATRMHLYLWNFDWHLHTTGALVLISV
ncbi:hypothetical protein DEU56DRAFT_64879 [Suillus clintonianus]|uniref:uncharacterized protein n=1 Tax=Suillus clintonianus TaxID=1904413 RepID=UPI001B86C177|nr:uncharacterized protein DEU56DRAFT_64879 [Suillus clintonianus]KAG2123066.1 hypothetical protein DEU56DRAFT_64879 [Suillus clintonianus]